jgi:anaerobic ribonucleoside-triphosphate reductase activating protein
MAMEQVLSVAGVMGDSIVDGPGIRTAIFVQGCIHHCPGCHNPESWPFEGGTPFTVAQLYALVKKNPLCRGVTFSGGEPFCQPEPLAALARKLKADGYEVAAYTGYTFEELLQGTPAQRFLLDALDVLVDGRFVQEQRNLDLRFRGSENQRILDVPKSLAAGQAVWYQGERWTGVPAHA